MKLKLTKALVTSVATSVGLLGASAGLVFGVSAGMYKVRYMDLEDINVRLKAAQTQNCYSQNISSEWNMYKELEPKHQEVIDTEWNAFHDTTDVPQPMYSKTGTKIEWDVGTDEEKAVKRWNFATMSIDGSTHSTLDRSFNQSLYNGIINFIQNKDIKTTELKSESTVRPSTVLGNYTAASFKPSEDNNNGLTSTYKAIADTSTPFRMLGLAGFNHVSPLGDIGTASTEHPFVFGEQFKNLRNMLMLLIDGSVSHNQSVSSVLFRADQPGFLTAIATCMYFYNNLHIYHKDYKDLSVAAYGGNPIPTVTVYMGGFQRGLEFFNKLILLEGILNRDLKEVVGTADPMSTLEGVKYKDLKHLIDYSKTKDEIHKFLKKEESKYTSVDDVITDLYDEYKIHQIQLGAYATHFTGSFTAGDAIGITKQYLTRGASAIIAVAGPQSLDSAQEIQNQGSDCIVIGVDSAMENGQYQRKHTRSGMEDTAEADDGSTPVQKDNIIKFSAVKDITTVTRKFCDLCVANQNFDIPITDAEGNIKPDPDRAICGVGYKTCGNILNGLISISFDGWHPLVQALKHVNGGGFETSWSNAALTYFQKLPVSQKPVSEVQDALRVLTNIDTYNPDLVIAEHTEGSTTTQYTVEQCYNHITGILGVLLSSEDYKIDFSGMTVIKDETTGEIRLPTGTEAKMTILEWLTNNMYFTC